MGKPIKQGDEVIVVLSQNCWFEFQTGPSFLAKVDYLPTAPGDTWHFDVKGKTIIINPMSSEFVGMELYEEEELPF